MIDLYLRAESASALLAALSAAGLTALDDQGEERPVPASHRHALAILGPLPGDGRCHANLRWLEDGEPPAELSALAVYPATPSVVWA